MDFDFTDEQLAVRDLANQIFDGMVSVERIKAVEATDDRIDRDLWSELAKANLLGLCLPEEHGGSGLGMVELSLMLEAQGRRLAPVPLLATIALGALPIAEFGTAAQQSKWLPAIANGNAVVTAALDEPGALDPTAPRTTVTVDNRIHGFKTAVPSAHVADCVLVPALRVDGTVGVFLVDPAGPGVEREFVDTTDHQGAAHLVLDGAPGDELPGADVGWIRDRGLVALCAIQYGVAQEALRLAAEYTSGRLQFGKPLSTFQGVALRAADVYIDTSAIAVTLWQAAWRLDEGLDASKEIAVAKWWAADGGERVVHVTQHLHGGMGADVDYPVHRYFLWGKQIAAGLGGGSRQLARLGAELADAYR